MGYFVGSSSWFILMAIVGFVIYKTKRPESLHMKNNLLPFLNPVRDNVVTRMSPVQGGNTVLAAEMSGEILLEIEAYCKWANIPDLAAFIEKSTGLVFSKDKDWIRHQLEFRRNGMQKHASHFV